VQRGAGPGPITGAFDAVAGATPRETRHPRQENIASETVLESSSASLVGDEHEERKAAITALRTTGYRDPEETRTVQDLTDPTAWDKAALERELRDHPAFDVAYVRAAYPTRQSEDHEHANPFILREGVATCRRKGYLLARLSSYCSWQEDSLAALDHAVASVLVGDPSQGPGDMVQVLELLAIVFRKTELFSDAVIASAVQASYTLGSTEASAVERAARTLADRHAGEVNWAADTVRERLSEALAEKRRST